MAKLFNENNDLVNKKKVEFNHIKVSGDQVSQETSNESHGEIDINKVKEENDKKMKKVLIEEVKEKEDTKKEELKKENEKENKKVEEKKDDKKEKKEATNEIQEVTGNELDDLD